jgi:hypothetical protein
MTDVVSIYFDSTPTNVTPYVTSVSCKRGRNRELDRFTTGTAQIVFNNEDRRFDPLNTAGPYFGKLNPRLRVTVSTNSISVFDGVIEDWNLDYDISGKSDASITCVDGLALLAQTVLEETEFDAGTPKDRILAVITKPEVSYQGAVNLDPGINLLAEDLVPDDTDTLNYLELVVATDLGRLFVDGAGVLRYRERTSGILDNVKIIFALESSDYIQGVGTMSGASLWIDPTNPNPVRIDDLAKTQMILQDANLWIDSDTADWDNDYIAPLIPFTEVEVELGSEFLFNRIQVSNIEGDSVTAENTASIAKFGIRTYSQTGLLFPDEASTQAFADFLADLYGEPDVRITKHSVALHGLTEQYANFMLRLEIGDVVRTIWIPNNVGEPIDRTSLVEGIEHQIGVDTHTVRVQLTPFSTAGFVLDDPERGLLDTSELTY